MAISLEPGARPPATAAGAAAPSATETRLRLIIESAPVSLTVTTQDGMILAANARAIRLFQVERLENLVGSKFDRLIAADDRPRVVATLDGVYKGEDAHLTYRVAGSGSAGRAVDFLRSNLAAAPLVYSSVEPERVRQAQERYGGGAALHAAMDEPHTLRRLDARE